jgi:hypothetical protein
MLARREPAAATYGEALRLYEQAGYARGQIAALERLGRLSADADAQAARSYASRAEALRQQLLRAAPPS